MGKITKSGNGIPKPAYVERRVDDLVSGIQMFMDASKSDATKRAYRKDWASFSAFCENNGLLVMPATPETVCAYMTALAEAGRKPSTISRHLTTISQAHSAFRERSPTGDYDVRQAFRGIRRIMGTAQRKAKALMWSDMVKVCCRIRPTYMGKRDKALLLVGWSAALRRSELVALDYEDIDFVAEGMVVTIKRSKTDQEGEGYKIGIPLAQDSSCCPTVALRDWIGIAEIKQGPLFYAIGNGGKKFFCETERERFGARGVNYVIARRLEKAGINPDGYSGHSLRAGYITTASRARVPVKMIQDHTRHRSVVSLNGYIRRGGLFNDNPLSVIF